MKDHKNRDTDALPTGDVAVEGLLRSPWKKNMFTPDNRPDIGEFYFRDIQQMAGLDGAQPVWVEETTGLLHLASLQFYIFFFCRFSRSRRRDERESCRNANWSGGGGEHLEQPSSVHHHLVCLLSK
jgi:hypothetical protein